MSLSFTVIQTETGSPLLSRRPLTERFLHLLSICELYKQEGTALLGLTTLSNIIKMSVLSNLGYKFNGLLVKIPMSIFS